MKASLRFAKWSLFLCLLALHTSFAAADTADFDAGQKLILEARQERDARACMELLGKATAKFEAFLKAHADDQRTNAARTQLSSIHVEIARVHLQAGRNARDEEQRKAKFKESRQSYGKTLHWCSEIENHCKQRLGALRVPANPEQTRERDSLRRDYLQAQLLSAATLEELSDAHEDKAQQKKTLEDAATKYNDIYTKYRTRLAGLYARLYEGRCYKKLGQMKEAVACFRELLDMPDTPAPFRSLKMKTIGLAMECWTSDSLQQFKEATVAGQAALDKATDAEKKSPDYQHLQVLLARAYLGYSNSKEMKTQLEPRAVLMLQAANLAKAVANKKNADGEQARKILRESGYGEKQPTNVPLGAGGGGGGLVQSADDLKTFAAAYDSGKDAMKKLSTLMVDVQKLKASLRAPSADKDQITQKLKVAEAELNREQSTTIKLFARAIKLADGKKDIDTNDLNNARYYLGYLHYSKGEHAQAAEATEAVARSSVKHAAARACAKIAMASYMQMYSIAKTEKDEDAAAKKAISIARYILKHWAKSSVGQDAIKTLAPFLMKYGTVDEAEEYIKSIPTDDPYRLTAITRFGLTLWPMYMQLKSDKKADKAQVEKRKGLAEKYLAQAIDEAKKAKKIDSLTVRAALCQVQLALTSGEAQKAVDLLQDKEIGGMALLDQKSPLVKQNGTVRGILQTAARAYAQVGDQDKAKELTKRLDELKAD